MFMAMEHIWMKGRYMNRCIFEFSKFGDYPALISSDETVTYSQMNYIVELLREVFESKNLIFQICTNTVGSIAGYAAFINLYQVPLLLDAYVKEEAIRLLINKYRPEYIYIPEYMVNEYDDCIVVKRIYDYILLKSNCIHEDNINPDLALMLSTSGSLASSKYVRLSYDNLYENACSIIEFLNINSHERPITMLPMNYTYGLSVINSHLMSGACIIVTEYSIYNKEFWEMANREQITSISGVPYTYESLYKMGFTRAYIPSLKTMTQAGGKLSEKLQRIFSDYADKNNIRFFIMYGQTEATARMTYLPYKAVGKKIGSVGIAIPGGDIEINNDCL